MGASFDWCSAIANGMEIEFIYQGKRRVVHPYVHGVSTAGNEVIRAWQVDGASSSGTLPGWRPFLVAEIENPSATGQTSGPVPPHYNPKDSMMGGSPHCHV